MLIWEICGEKNVILYFIYCGGVWGIYVCVCVFCSRVGDKYVCVRDVWW